MVLLNEISLDSVPGDIVAGITAVVIALPMGLAFGVIFGAGADADLFKKSAA